MANKISLVAEWLDEGTSPFLATSEDFKKWAKLYPAAAPDRKDYVDGRYYHIDDVDLIIQKIVNNKAVEEDFVRLADLVKDVARPALTNFSDKEDDTLDRTLTDADTKAVATEVVQMLNDPQQAYDDEDPNAMQDPNAMAQGGMMAMQDPNMMGVPQDPNAMAGAQMQDPNMMVGQDPNAMAMQDPNAMAQGGGMMPAQDPNMMAQGAMMPMVDPEQQRLDTIAQLQATFPAPTVVTSDTVSAMMNGQEDAQMVAFSVLDLIPSEAFQDKKKYALISFCMNRLGLSSHAVADFANIKLGIDNRIINFSQGRKAIKNIIEKTVNFTNTNS